MHDFEVELKEAVRSHWMAEVCGEREGADHEAIAAHRDRTHPYLASWADYASMQGKRVLEIGLGTGIDCTRWAAAGADVTGVDLTQRAVDETKARANSMGLSNLALQVADAENLPFQDASFDLVYSFGVLHHTPDTMCAFAEAFRVMKSGGKLKAMVYRIPSWTGWLLAVRYMNSPRRAIFEHLESPGTKAYKDAEAVEMLQNIGFSRIRTRVELAPGDTLEITLSSKYKGILYRAIQALYPSGLIRRYGQSWGLFLLITAEKPTT